MYDNIYVQQNLRNIEMGASMRLAVVHLSDIHFSEKNNPITTRFDHISRAVLSADPSPTLHLIVVSGDVANSGAKKEYEVALDFFGKLKQEILKGSQNTRIEFISVPGNHDCVLPKEEINVRDALISGLLPSIQESEPDPGLLQSLLKAQANFNWFRKQLAQTNEPWNGISETNQIHHSNSRIQINCYNTALLSRRVEAQGQLHLPVKMFGSNTAVQADTDLSISVFHHSYVWLESNNQAAVRSHIERTSDIAFLGHQHIPHSFYKANSTGERVLYLEGGALQDEQFPQHSAFQVLVFDFSTREEMSVAFRWDRDHFKRHDEIPWRPITLNRSIRSDFTMTEPLEQFLSDLGSPCEHKIKGNLRLRDIYIYPEFRIRKQGGKPGSLEVKGEEITKYVATTPRIIFQGPAFSGKTCLAKILFGDLFITGNFVPLYFDGRKLRISDERRVVELFWETAAEHYGEQAVEGYRQLQKERRVLILDAWHDTELNADGRRAFLRVAAQYFGKIILFTDEIYQIQELAEKSTEMMFEFDHATIHELSHARRGVLIDRWTCLGREHTVKKNELNREIEETESFVQSVIGKNTLPSLPFIILCILQVQQEDKPDAPEAGSFGHLYEVLVTRALNSSVGRKPQLEKKYVFLARLAYYMFRRNLISVPSSTIHELAAEYSSSYKVRVDITSILADLENGRVLINMSGNYSFAYPHFFQYFVARYYKDNLGRQNSPDLKTEISDMVDHLSSDKYSTILMFILYFARDSAGVIDKLVANADRIYSQEKAANLDSDVAFLIQLSKREEFALPTEVDVEANRRERRELRDRLEKSDAGTWDKRERDYVYSEDLSDSDKFRLAIRHIELLGQVIRNFPGSLPGTDKLHILRATYLLGLRVLHALLGLLERSVDQFRKGLAEVMLEEDAKHYKKDAKAVRRSIEQFILFVGKVFSLGMILKVAASVGLSDLEDAYAEVLEEVGKTNATQLIDIAIKLEHSKEFPEESVEELHDGFSKNHLADGVLTTLVIGHMRKYGVDQRLLQRVTSILGVKANAPQLVEATQLNTKKKKKSRAGD